MTVPVDPRGAPTLGVEVAAVVARQANLRVEIIGVPELGSWQPVDLRPYVRAALASGAPQARAHVVPSVGRPAAAIVERVDRDHTLLVCMATHSRSAFGVLTLGSVSSAVLRRTSVPVLLVGPGVRRIGPAIRRVVACVDGSACSEQALAAGADLAARLGAQLLLLRVVPPGTGARACAGAEGMPELADLAELAERFPDRAPLLDVVEHDDPAAGIARYAGHDGDTIVAVGSHGRSVLRDAVLGSVARDVTRRAACPVLVVPPGVHTLLVRRAGP